MRAITLVACVALITMSVIMGCGNSAQENPVKADNYFEQEQWTEAIDEYTKVIQGGNGTALIYSNRGYSYNQTGTFDKAIADSNKAIELNPELAVAYFTWGYAYAGKGELDKAIIDFD